MLSPFTVVLDSCVLYPAPMRDLLVQCASEGLFRGKLTAEINHEWTSNLLANRPDLNEKQLKRTCELFEHAMPDCLVTNYEALIDGLSLPDLHDRHVLAAAIRCQAQIIVTSNLKDFPAEVLAKYDIEALHPDVFLHLQAGLSLPRFLGCVKSIRTRLKNPPKPAEDYLVILASQGLIRTASFLRDYVELF